VLSLHVSFFKVRLSSPFFIRKPKIPQGASTLPAPRFVQLGPPRYPIVFFGRVIGHQQFLFLEIAIGVFLVPGVFSNLCVWTTYSLDWGFPIFLRLDIFPQRSPFFFIPHDFYGGPPLRTRISSFCRNRYSRPLFHSPAFSPPRFFGKDLVLGLPFSSLIQGPVFQLSLAPLGLCNPPC